MKNFAQSEENLFNSYFQHKTYLQAQEVMDIMNKVTEAKYVMPIGFN